MDWAVYTLRNPASTEIKYVGKTHQRPEERLKQHLRSSASNPRTPVQLWVKSLLDMNCHPVIEVIESGSGPGWSAAERRWIASHRAQGVVLLNKSSGGQGAPGVVHTPEQRRAQSDRTRAQMARLTPDERSALAKKGYLNMSAEKRAKRVAASAITFGSLTFEQRSAAMKKGRANMPPEARSASARTAALAMNVKRTRAERIAIAIKSNQTLTTETRSAARKRAHETKTPEERSAIVAKGHVARLKR